MLASELLDLLKERHPDKLPVVELTSFRHGELVGIQTIIKEMEAEIKHASNK